MVQRLARMLEAKGVGGNLRIAQMLARAGIKIGREPVRRYRQRAPRRPPENGTPGPTLRAKYPNHIWLADLSEIRGLYGWLRFKLVVVLDLFSRFPLAFKVFTKEPSSEEMLGVLDQAIRTFGKPRHFISDQGSQFTAQGFRETLEALKIKQRFGAIGQFGSIAIIERFWRTLKHVLAIRILPPLNSDHLESRLETTLAYYSALRPHQGLNGATPWEIFCGKDPAA